MTTNQHLSITFWVNHTTQAVENIAVAALSFKLLQQKFIKFGVKLTVDDIVRMFVTSNTAGDGKIEVEFNASSDTDALSSIQEEIAERSAKSSTAKINLICVWAACIYIYPFRSSGYRKEADLVLKQLYNSNESWRAFESNVATNYNKKPKFSLFTYVGSTMHLLNEDTPNLFTIADSRHIYLLPTCRPYSEMVMENLVSNVIFPWGAEAPPDYLSEFQSSSTNKLDSVITTFLSSVSNDELWEKYVDATYFGLSSVGRVISEAEEYNEATRRLIINFAIINAADYLLESEKSNTAHVSLEKEMKNSVDSIGNGPLDYIVDGRFLVHKILDVNSSMVDDITEGDTASSSNAISLPSIAASIKVDAALTAHVSAQQIIEAKCRIINESIAQLIAQLYDRLVTSYDEPLQGKKRGRNEPPFVRGVLTTGQNYEFFQLTNSADKGKPVVHHYGSLPLRVFRGINKRNNGRPRDVASSVFAPVDRGEVVNVLAAFVLSLKEREVKCFI
jgi:hypothetical protein